MPKKYPVSDIRNIAFIGHIGTGKTTLTEAILFKGGVIEQRGETSRGTTVSDYTDEEIEHKMSIHTTLSFIEWNGRKVNILDTPGSGDFVGEVRPAFRVAETAVFVVDAEMGIEIETEKNWHRANEYKITRAIFINKMDKEGINFDEIVETIKSDFPRFSPAPIQIPIGSGKDFKGVIDLITHKAYITENGKTEIVDIPEEYKDAFETARENLKEMVCEVDDALMEKYLGGEPFSDEELGVAFEKAMSQTSFVPILCGSAETIIGMKAFLDAVVEHFPSPLSNSESIGINPDNGKEAIREMNRQAPFSAFVFKTVIDRYVGRYSFIKVRSGAIIPGDEIMNDRTHTKEKVSHLYTMIGKKQVEINSVFPGDIAVIAKLTDTITNDSISCASEPIIYPKLKMPQPIYFTAITFSKNEQKALDMLHRCCEENPTLHLEFDNETKETIIKAMGEQQVNLELEKVKKATGAEFELSIPTVAYRETIKEKTQASYRHKKQSGGRGQFAEVYLEVIPDKTVEHYEFINNIVGGAIPKGYIPGVEKGVVEAMETGPLARFPVKHVRVRVFDGKYHDVDSSELAFKIASSQAMKEALKNASAVLLEPVMSVHVFVPEEFTGDVMNELTAKRGKILGMDKVSDRTQEVKAQVPLSEMLTYCIDLKTHTSGKGTFEMELSHYQELSAPLAQKVISVREEKLAEK